MMKLRVPQEEFIVFASNIQLRATISEHAHTLERRVLMAHVARESVPCKLET
jgi:hypothetical protein